MSKIKFYNLLTVFGEIRKSHHPGNFGGHKKAKIYGRLDCPSALRAIARGGYVKYRVFFECEGDAIGAGYRPCGTCMKEQYNQWKELQRWRNK